MRRRFATRSAAPAAAGRPDRWLLLIPLGLTAAGLVLVYSASSFLGFTHYGDGFHFVARQAGRALVGLVAFVLLARLDYHRLERWSKWVFLAALALLLALALPGFGSEVRRVERWTPPVLGFVFQPTELARVATLLFLCRFLARRADESADLTRFYLPALAIVGAAPVLVALQPNLSSAAVLFAAGAVVLYFAGARPLHLGATVALGAVGFVVMIARHDYQRERVVTYLRYLFTGELDIHRSGWQLYQSLIALGSGGIAGRGFGRGMQKFLFLPDPHTDFILSITGEEGGFLVTGGLVVVFLVLAWRGFRVAAAAPDAFGRLVAAGITSQFALYALVHMGVATGLLPTTGLPLPFVSYGGSALVMNLAAAGILLNISAQADARASGVRRARQWLPCAWLKARPRPAWEALR